MEGLTKILQDPADIENVQKCKLTWKGCVRRRPLSGLLQVQQGELGVGSRPAWLSILAFQLGEISDFFCGPLLLLKDERIV